MRRRASRARRRPCFFCSLRLDGVSQSGFPDDPRSSSLPRLAINPARSVSNPLLSKALLFFLWFRSEAYSKLLPASSEMGCHSTCARPPTRSRVSRSSTWSRRSRMVPHLVPDPADVCAGLEQPRPFGQSREAGPVWMLRGPGPVAARVLTRAGQGGPGVPGPPRDERSRSPSERSTDRVCGAGYCHPPGFRRLDTSRCHCSTA